MTPLRFHAQGLVAASAARDLVLDFPSLANAHLSTDFDVQTATFAEMKMFWSLRDEKLRVLLVQ